MKNVYFNELSVIFNVYRISSLLKPQKFNKPTAWNTNRTSTTEKETNFLSFGRATS